MLIGMSVIHRLLENEIDTANIPIATPITRTQDDCDGDLKGAISVTIMPDGDVHLRFLKPGSKRFRTFAGGGESQRTRRALVILAEAMRLDNLGRSET
jgi:hypothetical protein